MICTDMICTGMILDQFLHDLPCTVRRPVIYKNDLRMNLMFFANTKNSCVQFLNRLILVERRDNERNITYPLFRVSLAG